MSVRAKVYSFLALVAVLAVGGNYAYRHQVEGATAEATTENAAAKTGEEEKDEVIPVELSQAVLGPISSYLTSTANLRALRDVVVATQADGVVREILIEEGDSVGQDDLLVKLDDRELQINLKLTEQKLAQASLQLEKAKIQREKAEVQIRNKRAEYERNATAFKEGLVSEQEVDALRYQVQELEHDERVASSEVRELTHRVAELTAEIEQVKLEISRTRVRAPFAGLITERNVQLGQTVRTLDPLFRLGAFSPLYADVHLSEMDLQAVRPGQPAMVSLGAGENQNVQGRVVRISPVVDGSTGTVKVTVELRPSERAFRPGAFVRVDIETDSKPDAILVQKRAVLEEDGQNYLFIAEGDTAHRKEISLGYENEGLVEVRQGVEAGESIVVAGQGNLKEGSKIREVETESQTASLTEPRR